MNIYKNILFFSLIMPLLTLFDVQLLAAYRYPRTIFSDKTRSVKNQKSLSLLQRWGDLTKKVYNSERSMPKFKIKNIDKKSDKKFNTSSTVRYFPNISTVFSSSYHVLQNKIKEKREKDIENLKKNARFYEDLLGVLATIKKKPIETTVVKDDKNFVTSKIDTTDYDTFIHKYDKMFTMSSNSDLLENINKGFKWINSILQNPHPSEKNSTFNQWFADNVSIPLVFRNKKIDVESAIVVPNIIKFLRESKEFPNENLIKNVLIDASVKYIQEQDGYLGYLFAKIMNALKDNLSELIPKINNKEIKKLHIVYFIIFLEKIEMPDRFKYYDIKARELIKTHIYEPITELLTKQSKIKKRDQQRFLDSFNENFIKIILQKAANLPEKK